MNAATLKKSFNDAIEELEEPLDELLEKSRDDDIDDDDELEDDDDDLSKSEDDDEEDEEDEEDDEDDNDTILAKARKIVKDRRLKKAGGKKKSKGKMTDDDYTDDEIDDDDDDMDNMDKAILMDDPEISRDRQVLNVGRGMKTIIYMRKSMRSQGRLIKSLRKDVRDLTSVLSGNVQLTQKIGELVINGTNLSKAIKDEIDEIGDQPERTKTVVKKSKRGTDFENPTNAAEANILLEKSMKAVRDHRLPSELIPMLETRVRSLPGNPDVDLFEPTGLYSDHWLALKGYLKAS